MPSIPVPTPLSTIRPLLLRPARPDRFYCRFFNFSGRPDRIVYCSSRPYPANLYATTHLPLMVQESCQSISLTLCTALSGATLLALAHQTRSSTESIQRSTMLMRPPTPRFSPAFATQPRFRDHLWREIEDILVKGLFSGPEQDLGTRRVYRSFCRAPRCGRRDSRLYGARCQRERHGVVVV